MWEWFTVNSVWILIASALVSILLIVFRNRILADLKKTALKKKRKEPYILVNTIIWTIEAICLGLVATALAAIIMSRQGASKMITTETIQAWILQHGIIVLIIIAVSFIVYRLLRLVIPEIVERSIKVRGKGKRAREELQKRTHTLSSILSSTSAALIGLIALFMLLSEVGLNITPLLASAGVIGIAIGFGAQSLIKDVLNGLFILMEDQYNKGDVVKVAGISGIVEDINLKRTVLRDLDGIVHSIPNGEITTSSNYTRDWSRVNLDVPVAYGEDLDRVIEVINRVGNELTKDKYFGPKIIAAPQVLRVNNFGDSGIDIKILGDTKPLTQWEVTGELRKRIKKAFDEEGIEIPWPHVKLYFGQGSSKELLVCKVCFHPNAPDSRFCAKCGAVLTQP